MSAEVENSKEEDTKEQPKKSLKQKFQANWQIGIKILELLICGVCMGFIYEPARTIGLGKIYLHHAGIMYTAYTGYMLINLIFLISRAIDERIPYRTTVLFSINGAALFLVTAVLLTVDRATLTKNYSFHPNTYRLTMMTTSIFFAFVNVVVFILDALFTYVRRQDF